MQRIVIELPQLGERIDFRPDQWKPVRQWLEEQKIPYRVKRPDESPAAESGSSTILVLEIVERNRAVSDYLSRPSRARADG